MFNPFKKEKSTDQWIYGVASTKGGLNKALHESLKTGSVASAPTTHEELEEMVEKIAGIKFLSPVTGALLGAGYGALMGGTPPRTKREIEQDPNAVRRNRISSIVAGAIGGSLGGALAEKGLIQSGFLLAAPAPLVGTSVAGLLAPPSKVPQSAVDVIGKGKLEYSDRKVFEKYWETFGSELESKGPSATLDPEKERKFIDALKDIYTEASAKNTDPTMTTGKKPSKAGYLVGAGLSTLGPAAWFGALAAQDARARGFSPSAAISVAALTALTPALAIGGESLRGYRRMYLDPGVAVKSKADARTRKKFNEDQLRQLLRGVSVDQIKTKRHVIG
jgi:hypothetical protein